MTFASIPYYYYCPDCRNGVERQVSWDKIMVCPRCGLPEWRAHTVCLGGGCFLTVVPT